MKSTICKLIMQAPKVYVSSTDPRIIRSEMLIREAWYLRDLLQVLMYHYNSAVEPQATMYERISRIQDKAIRRHHRRNIAGSVLFYYTTDSTPNTNHVYYGKIMEGIKKHEPREKNELEEIGV